MSEKIKFEGNWGSLREQYSSLQGESSDYLRQASNLSENTNVFATYLEYFQGAYSDMADICTKQLETARGVNKQSFENNPEYLAECAKITEDVLEKVSREIQR